MGTILVTGATGFVGQALCSELIKRGRAMRAVLRSASGHLVTGCEPVIVPEINADTDWRQAFAPDGRVDTVVHLAARVHVMCADSASFQSDFKQVNVAGTERLARAAAAMGARRLVYVSSVKVNGEETVGEQKFAESDQPAPQDPYGLSKWEAEQALHRVAAETGIEIVIVRSPLVYGPGVKGNFALMLSALRRGLPMPLASARNLRSLVYIGNLVDALIACTTHPAAAMQTYLVSDGEDVSTPDLLCRLGAALEHPARLLPCPLFLLRCGGWVLGYSGQLDRLLGSLRVDSRKIRRELNWTPPFTLQQGLIATTQFKLPIS
jgi:nucleoside-diphosphate-sugar epimerase